MPLNLRIRNYKDTQVNSVAQVQVTDVQIMEQRIVVLEDTIRMLSYNLRCLEIRHGSQPFELPEKEAETVFIAEGPFDCMYKLGQEQPNLNYQFGADEEAWAK